MKPFNVYQYLAGEEMTERDKLEVDSPFWNKGKWDNFVLPLIKEVSTEMTFVDMGCNAGLFLKLAQDAGFGQIIGVDSCEEAVKKGQEWRDKNGGNYQFLCKDMEKCIEELPVADYTVLANSHYYMTINDWLDYLDRLQYKTRYVIIVTAEKHHTNRCWASADITDIRRYFRTWEEVGFIDELPLVGANPRRLWGLCFKSPFIERVPIESLDCGNHVQDQFYSQLDSGMGYKDTRYYHIIKKYREGKWSQNRIDRWFEERIRVYESVKQTRLLNPILISHDNKILEGNHRYAMMSNLGFKTILVRKT